VETEFLYDAGDLATYKYPYVKNQLIIPITNVEIGGVPRETEEQPISSRHPGAGQFGIVSLTSDGSIHFLFLLTPRQENVRFSLHSKKKINENVEKLFVLSNHH
jgi:hypothetical protein